MRKLAPALIVSLGLAACGTRPPEVPDLSHPAGPSTYTTFTSPSGDVSFSRPVNWPLIPRTFPGVATVASGGASVTVWAYRATSPVLGAPEARAALRRLLASLKKRDPSFKVTESRLVGGYGGPAAQIEGATRVHGQPIRVRSVHVWKGAGEYVVDGLADPAAFALADKAAFGPLLKSLRLGGRPAPTARPATPAAPVTPAAPAPND